MGEAAGWMMISINEAGNAYIRTADHEYWIDAPSPETFTGIHYEYVTVVVYDYGRLDTNLRAAIDSLVTAYKSRVIDLAGTSGD